MARPPPNGSEIASISCRKQAIPMWQIGCGNRRGKGTRSLDPPPLGKRLYVCLSVCMYMGGRMRRRTRRRRRRRKGRCGNSKRKPNLKGGWEKQLSKQHLFHDEVSYERFWRDAASIRYIRIFRISFRNQCKRSNESVQDATFVS